MSAPHETTMSNRPRLQRPQAGSLLTGPLGRVIARPWFDPVALFAIGVQGFPASRLWAAASVADGDIDRFVDAIGRAPRRMPPRAMTVRALRRIADNQRAYAAADAAWIDGFFGSVDVPEEQLIELERHWRRVSDTRYTGRRHVAPLVWYIRPPRVRYQVPSVAAVMARYSPTTSPAVDPLAAPKMPQESRAILTNFGIEYWLRMESPLEGDTLWAHVYEPEGVRNPPTAILCHGLGMEFEMMGGVVDSSLYLMQRGFRVVHPSAPGHNRRCKPGFYGGEELLATQPLGSIELLRAATVELGQLIRWAHVKSDGAPVVLGGTSLGALTAQFVACRTRKWRSEFRPDGLFLATTSGLAGALATISSLARTVELPAALKAAGWHADALKHVALFTDPEGPAPMDPRRIVMVVADHDTVTPAEDGMALARRWMLPGSNVFRCNRGHFSAAIGLLFDRAPYDALAERLNAPAPTL